MKKLRNKVFYTVLGILTISLLVFLIVFNVQKYREQKKIIERNLSFNNHLVPPKDTDKEMMFDKNIRFMDSNIITVLLDSNDNVVEVIDHSTNEVSSETYEIIQSILNSSNLQKRFIGSLYTEKYSYSYHKGNSLILVDNQKVNETLIDGLKVSILFFLLLEMIMVIISKIIASWISKPVEDSFQKQKEFIADASHELKTPLSVIVASTEALENNPKEKKWLNNIKNESERMNNLITDLLELAKTEKENNLLFSTGNLSKVVELSVLTFEARAFEKNIKLDYDIDSDIMFKMDERYIKQLVEILLDNAIKHSKEKGKVTVNLKDGNNIMLTVSNIGDEIPKGEEEKIFERFYRIDKARNRNDNRYGLGLAIAKNIVINHQGTIMANSNSGITTFKVLLKK